MLWMGFYVKKWDRCKVWGKVTNRSSRVITVWLSYNRDSESREFSIKFQLMLDSRNKGPRADEEARLSFESASPLITWLQVAILVKSTFTSEKIKEASFGQVPEVVPGQKQFRRPPLANPLYLPARDEFRSYWFEYINIGIAGSAPRALDPIK